MVSKSPCATNVYDSGVVYCRCRGNCQKPSRDCILKIRHFQHMKLALVCCVWTFTDFNWSGVFRFYPIDYGLSWNTLWLNNYEQMCSTLAHGSMPFLSGAHSILPICNIMHLYQYIYIYMNTLPHTHLASRFIFAKHNNTTTRMKQQIFRDFS